MAKAKTTPPLNATEADPRGAFDWARIAQALGMLLSILQQLFPPIPVMGSGETEGKKCDEHELLDHAVVSAAGTLCTLLELHGECSLKKGTPPAELMQAGTCFTFCPGGGVVSARVCAETKDLAKEALVKMVDEMSGRVQTWGTFAFYSIRRGVEVKMVLTKEMIADDANWSGP